MTAQSTKQVTIIGGSGFVGRYVVKLLAQKGWRIKIACRNPRAGRLLQPLGGVGQISAVRANIRDARSHTGRYQGADAIVNLAGILSQAGAQSFDDVHVEGARRVAEAAKTYEICNYVHVSALGANPRFQITLCPQQGLGRSQNIGDLSKGRHFAPFGDFWRRG